MAIVLIVDDDAITRSLIASLMIEQGATVEEAPDGEAAIERLRKIEVDLVVLDILMPRRDGFEVLKWLTKNRPQIPVAAISGVDTGPGDSSYADLAVRLGANRAFRKPITPEDVAEALSLIEDPDSGSR